MVDIPTIKLAFPALVQATLNLVLTPGYIYTLDMLFLKALELLLLPKC